MKKLWIPILLSTIVALAMRSPNSRHVRVYKKSRRLEVLDASGNVMRHYRVALGDSPKGPKQCEGDEKTPEGEYRLDFVNERSKFHRSIHVNYPLPHDRATAKRLGCSPGGDIFLHGTGATRLDKVHSLLDWTDGCVAVTNAEIDEIISLLKLPAKIELLP